MENKNTKIIIPNNVKITEEEYEQLAEKYLNVEEILQKASDIKIKYKYNAVSEFAFVSVIAKSDGVRKKY